jgi:hypothetical protein
MFSQLAIVKSILDLFASLTQYFRDQRLVQAGKDAARVEDSVKTTEKVTDALKVQPLTDGDIARKRLRRILNRK